MRILIVLREFYCPSRPIGGAERQALNLAKKLMEKGVTVTIVTGQWERNWGAREEIEGVPVYRHFTGWFFFNIKGLRKLSQYVYLLTLYLYLFIHRNEYDLIHCHSAVFDAAIAVTAGRQLRKKTLVRSTTSGRWGDIKRLQEGERGSIAGTGWMLGQLKKADVMVALNEQILDELLKIGIDAPQIVRLPNGVITEHVKPKTDYTLNQKVVITFVGRLHPQKGLDVLLPAFKKVVQTQPTRQWQLNLIGEGRMRLQTEAAVEQLELALNVKFFGQVTDPSTILGQSDIFVLPSRAEGMSNALLEAMAHGLPCIATNIPGNNDVIVNLKNGLLVPPDDSEGLANAIISLTTDDTLRRRIGLAALQTVKDKYSMASVTAQYIRLYKNLLQHHEVYEASVS